MAKGQKAAPRSTWSDERRKNADQYKYNHYSVIGASLDRDMADSFRSLCKSSGISVSAALSKYVRAAIQAGTLDIIRRDIPGRENADQENETPGTVGRRPVSDTPGPAGKLDSLCNMTNTQFFPAE